MVKAVNRYTSNEFHDWQRSNLPGKFVIQDLDTWPIVISDSSSDYEPVCIVELKRSFYEPVNWRPYQQDWPNYMALYKLALRAKIPFVTIYFKMDEAITDTSSFALFMITEVSNSGSDRIKYARKVISASEFKKDFPNSLFK